MSELKWKEESKTTRQGRITEYILEGHDAKGTHYKALVSPWMGKYVLRLTYWKKGQILPNDAGFLMNLSRNQAKRKGRKWVRRQISVWP